MAKLANIFGAILNDIMQNYSIAEKELCSGIKSCAYITIKHSCFQKWKNGDNFPSVSKMEALYKCLLDKVQANKNNGINATVFNSIHCRLLGAGINGYVYDNNFSEAEKIVGVLNFLYSTSKSKRSYYKDIESTGVTRAVFFDFDGTLTKGNVAKTTWETIWEKLGYGVSECRDLHKRFDKKEITHQQWCDITCEKFKEKSLTKKLVDEVAVSIELLDGVRDVFDCLRSRDIKIYIVSGSIKQIIQLSLGPLCSYISDIKANEFDYAGNELFLTRIRGTHFDFEHKADFVVAACRELSISPIDTLFVGNSYNDQWVCSTGAKTLCINPKDTNQHDTYIWHNSIECNDLKDILCYINAKN